MMFEKYMKERQNAECIKNEKGFLFYRIQNDECYIVDIFIEESFRKTSASSEIIGELESRVQGSKYISGNVYLSDPGCHRTLKAAFKQGFKIHSANNNILLIVKEL
jgi:hypothetical protein